ncbi:MAG: hypothetical protein WA842_05055 [Croceibacterium sp.]
MDRFGLGARPVTDFNPYKYLKAAAAGDVEAMRFLAKEGGDAAMRDNDIAIMCEALVMARMAYAATGAEADGGAILSLLGLGLSLSEHGAGSDYTDFWKAESIALASLLADRGCELCAQHLEEFVSSASPETAAWAKDVRTEMEAI